MVMVKPGMPYLDIVRRVKDEFKCAYLRLSSERRIRHAQGGRAKRLAERGSLASWRACWLSSVLAPTGF